jgi:hypothetical protein
VSSSPEDGNVSSFRHVIFLVTKILSDGQSPNTVMPSDMYYFSELVALFLPVHREEHLRWATNDSQCSAINKRAKSRKLCVRGCHLSWIEPSGLLPRSVNQAWNYDKECKCAYTVLFETKYDIVTAKSILEGVEPRTPRWCL